MRALFIAASVSSYIACDERRERDNVTSMSRCRTRHATALMRDSSANPAAERAHRLRAVAAAVVSVAMDQPLP